MEARDAYEMAFEACRKAKCKELAVIVMNRHAVLAEKAGDFKASAGIYERLGAFCEEAGALFLAADAYEHTAEMLQKTGRDISTYSKPLELWEQNVRYWEEQGHQDDAQWSRRHMDLYKFLVSGKPH